MAITDVGLITAVAATTAASGSENKVKALVVGLVTACAIQGGAKQPLSPSAQVKLAALSDEAVANAAEIQTALGL